MEAEHPEMDITEFCVWYLAEQTPRSEPSGIRMEDKLSAHLGRMNRYVQFYAKKAMLGLPLNNVEDAVYLIALSNMGKPKKSELIHKMLSEFPSGIDVIKRLINFGLIEEFPDEEDRRSKRVQITKKGREVLANCYPVMSKVGSMVFAQLVPAEKAMLLKLLIKLDTFHADHYKMARNGDFEEIYRQLNQ
jgi:DNA-binding MarR family transcriptional regulator